MKYPNLKAEMARRDLTAKKLSEAVAINPQTIHSWQHGCTPSVDKAIAVSDYLGMDIRYLFAEESIAPSA